MLPEEPNKLGRVVLEPGNHLAAVTSGCAKADFVGLQYHAVVAKLR
jgi:hypothetical protein